MFAPFRLPLICGIVLSLVLLVGCGQKGPLFMPIKQPVTPLLVPPEPQPSMATPAPRAAPFIPTPSIPVPASSVAPLPR